MKSTIVQIIKNKENEESVFVLEIEKQAGKKTLLALIKSSLLPEWDELKNSFIDAVSLQRKNLRFQYCAPCKIEVPGDRDTSVLDTEIEDFSVDGMGIKNFSFNVHKNEQVKCTFRLPYSTTDFETKAFIANVNADRIGLRFYNNGEKQKLISKKLTSYIMNHNSDITPDRRTGTRFPLQANCMISLSHMLPVKGTIRNVSYSGISVSGIPPEYQKGVEATITIPFRIEEDTFTGQIVWNSNNTSGIQFYEELELPFRNFYDSIDLLRMQVVTKVQNKINEKLSSHFVPDYYYSLDSFPVNQYGQVDEKALEDIMNNVIENEPVYLNEDEKVIQDTWNNNLNEIDNNSLNYNQLVGKIPMEIINKYPLLRLLRFSRNNELSMEDIKEEKKYYPLTHPQKRIWYSERLYPISCIGNLFHSCKFSVKVDFEKLKKAINILVRDNNILRLKFKRINSVPVQYISDYCPFTIDYFNFYSSRGDYTYKEWIKKIGTPLIKEDSGLFYFAVVTFPDGRDGFFFGIHHMITDETGIAFIIQQVKELYNKLCAKETVVSECEKPKDFCYSEYIQYENDYKLSDKFIEDEKFWLDKLAGYTEPAFIKQFDHVIDLTAKRKEYYLSMEIDNKIREFCKHEHTSVFRLFLAVLYIYLSLITGKNDIVIGSAFHNRFNDKFKSMIGMLVSTTPFRIKIEQVDFLKLLHYIKKEIQDIKEHQEYPYDILINKLNSGKKTGNQFIFDILLNYHNMDFALDTTWHFHGASNFPIIINISHRGGDGTFKLEIDYQTCLFSETEIDRLYDHFINLLINAMKTPKQNIFKLEILSDEEKHQILYEFNNTWTDYPRDKTIHQLFEEQVERTPENTAVVCNGKSLTYKELNEKVNQIAGLLINKKVRRNTFLGLMTDRSIEMIIGILGILKAGCAYAPVDISYPEERIKYMIKDCNTGFLLTTSDLKNKINFDGEYILLDDPEFYKGNKTNPISKSKPDDLAYIMYTSGSTGLPKGVMVKQRSIVRLVKNTNYIQFAEDDRILQTGSPVFDASTLEIWGTLLNGGSLYLINEESILDVNELKKALSDYRITILWLTSALFSQLALICPDMFYGLKYLLVGGDVLNPERINEVNKRCTNLKILNGYGPTENTTFSTTFLIEKEYKDNIPIGSPISNSTAYIVNKYNKLQPVGIPGELLVGGDGLASGYLNQPELTAEKFVANPFVRGEKIYKTGDLARWLPDGNIEFLGRIDQQVKIRGFRIELGEIESIVRENPQVLDAVVLADNTGHGDKELKAFIVPEIFHSLCMFTKNKNGEILNLIINDIPTNEIIIINRINTFVAGTNITLFFKITDIDNLIINGEVLWATDDYTGIQLNGKNINQYECYIKSYIQKRETIIYKLFNTLRNRLPDYMIPSHFFMVNAIPLTSNGKINRKALFSIHGTIEKIKEDTPESEVEIQLSKIWNKILKIDNAGINDNFFDIGGNSLKLIELQNELKIAFNKEIPIIKLFQYTSIRSIAEHLLLTDNKMVKKDLSPIIFKQESDITSHNSQEIAIIGMAGRFPGASNIEQFWNNLVEGKESISFFSDQELLDSGIDPELLKDPTYVKAKGKLDDIEYFDADFFSYSKKDAAFMDPQVRIFHEVIYEALETAGYIPDRFPGKIGLFAGASDSFYWQQIVYSDKTFFAEKFPFFILNKDFLSTRIAYKLDLKGPAYTVNTACSTSLVAVDMAVHALLENDCEIALAGGVSLILSPHNGYRYIEGFTLSPDGHCRAFDADAKGMVQGEGTGVVVLKRLNKALEDRDYIWAVIKGSATNNDGSDKIGFTAPSIAGQKKVIKKAIKRAGINPETITYVETHGTGTILGDPVEIEGLKAAFNTDKKQFCRIGSVKTNIGHLDVAAGITGLIKTVLMLKYKKIPPSLHFRKPNPKIDFVNSPFIVNDKLLEWERKNNIPLRAGVSAFGIGGTNAHVILEEANDSEKKESVLDNQYKLLLLSAKTENALNKIAENLYNYLDKYTEINLNDIAYTLQVSRDFFSYREMVICQNIDEAKRLLIEKKDTNILIMKIEDKIELTPKISEKVKNLLKEIKINNRVEYKNLYELGKLWCSGVVIDWQQIYLEQKKNRIPLPNYPFEKKRYFIVEPENNQKHKKYNNQFIEKKDEDKYKKKENIKNWFYSLQWINSVIPEPIYLKKLVYLIFLDNYEIGYGVACFLKEKKHEVITIKSGSEYLKINRYTYIINPQKEKDYRKLFLDIYSDTQNIDRIIHLFSLNDKYELSINCIEEALVAGYDSLLYIVRNINNQNMDNHLFLYSITNNCFNIYDDREINCSYTTILGAVKTIPLEYNNIFCSNIDIKLDDCSLEKFYLIKHIANESMLECNNQMIAYRSNYRLIKEYRPIKYISELIGKNKIKNKGVYLITGGLGGIGFTIAQELIKVYKARLIIISGRSPLPARKEWDKFENEKKSNDSIYTKIKRIKQLEKYGSEMYVMQADITKKIQLHEVIREGLKRFKKINGIIHAAGIADGKMIQFRKKNIDQKVLAPKIKGALFLNDLCKDMQLDFFLLCSSLTSINGTFGQVGYCAANAFLDSFAYFIRKKYKCNAISINWDSWKDIGMADDLQQNFKRILKKNNLRKKEKKIINTYIEHSIIPKEGIEVFYRILGMDLPQIIVSTINLNDSIIREMNKFLFTLSNKRIKIQNKIKTIEYNLEDIINKLKNIWQIFFRIKQIKIEDNFFYLGGDSLLAIQMIPEINKQFNINLSINTFLNVQTINDLSKIIHKMTTHTNDIKQINKPISNLIPLKKGKNENSPLFLIHPVAGTVYFYRDLCLYLADEQVVYGIEAQGVNGKQIPLKRIDKMAKQYISIIKQVQPKGPYYIGGSSLGGCIAYEMAYQLQQIKDEIGTIIMIDAPGPTSIIPYFKNPTEVLAYFLSYNNFDYQDTLKYLLTIPYKAKLKYFLNQNCVYQRILFDDNSMEKLHNLIQLTLINSKSMDQYFSYFSHFYFGEIIFFSATEKTEMPIDLEKDWEGLFKGKMIIHKIPGNHISINLYPQVKFIAEIIQQYIK